MELTFMKTVLKKIRKGLAALVLLLIFSGALLFADQFYFSGDRVSSVFAKGKERTLLSGHAKIISDANTIIANEIELFGEDSNYAECRGSVHMINVERGMELTCDELFYDRATKISRVQGNAVMVDRKNEVVVKGGFLENREEEDLVIIQIGVRILKEDMSCRAEFAKYLRKQDLLELTGMPVVFWKGDQYRAQKIIIDLKNDEVKLENNVEGEITTEEKKPAGETNPTGETNPQGDNP